MNPTPEMLDKMTADQEKKLNNDLIKAYQQALKNTRASIALVYEKYADADGVLTFAAMQKYDRLAALEGSIIKQLQSLYAKVGASLTDELAQMYASNYEYMAFIIENELQANLGFAMIPDEAVKKAIQNPIAGLTLNQRLNKQREMVIQTTREQLTLGLIQGESIPKMAKRIKDIYDGDASKSLRIAQTETNRVRNEGKQIAYNRAADLGIEFTKVWLSAVDSRTRDNHIKLDGMKANKDGYFILGRFKAQHPGGFGVAEMDINCRCTTRAEFAGLPPKVRRINGEIVDYKTFEEWKAAREPKKVKEPKKVEEPKNANFGHLDKTYADMVNKTFKDVDEDHLALAVKYAPRRMGETKETSHYSRVRDEININPTDAEDSQTILHEFGHAIDHGLGGRRGEYLSNGKDFRKAVLADRKTLLKQTPFEQRQMSLALRYDHPEERGLSDILCSITDQAIMGIYGHTKSYYKQVSGRREAEVFANLYEIHSSKNEFALGYMRANAPKTLEAYTELIRKAGADNV